MLDLIKIQSITDIELEYQVLATIINDIKRHIDLPEYYSSELFYFDCNKRIYATIENIVKDNQDEPTLLNKIEYITLFRYADKNGADKNILSKILSYSHINFHSNLRILKEFELKRKMLGIIAKEYNKIDKFTDVGDSFANLERKLFDLQNFAIGKEISMQSSVESHRELLKLKNERYVNGIDYAVTTGFKSLNNIITGFVPGELIVGAGRPGMGKTAITLQTLLSCNVPCLFLSLEMTTNSLLDRYILNLEDSINSFRLRNGMVDLMDLEIIEGAYSELLKKNIYIEDFSNGESKHIDNIINMIKMRVKKHNLEFVAIDYLNLINYSQVNDNDGFKYITMELKSLAKTLDIPILLLSQLNRDVEKRGGNIPQLSDLRGSGGIEENSDIIMFYYRDDYYTKPEPGYEQNTIDVIVAKNRQGSLGVVSLNHNSTITKIYENFNENSDIPDFNQDDVMAKIGQKTNLDF